MRKDLDRETLSARYEVRFSDVSRLWVEVNV